MASQELQLPHKLTLQERNRLTVTGVTEVISFDDTSVVLHTVLGLLEVQGRELKLKALSTDGGQMAVEGQVSGLFYEEPRSGGGFWQRLLK